MKKILTIAATALLSTIAGAAHAQTTPVNFAGTVASACTLSAPVDGTLTGNTTPPSNLVTDTSASVTATCNGATSLGIAVASTIFMAQTPAPTATVGFTNGTGIFATSAGVTTSLADSTASAGDIAKINAVVSAAPGKLLKAGAYSLVVNATITP